MSEIIIHDREIVERAVRLPERIQAEKSVQCSDGMTYGGNAPYGSAG